MAGDDKSFLRIPDWLKKYIDPRASRTGPGLQRAHMKGDNFLATLPKPFRDAFAELDRFGIGANYTSNFELLNYGDSALFIDSTSSTH
jgi:hypothetical protein